MVTEKSKWAIQQIFDIALFDITTNECYALLDDLKECALENSGDVIYAQGGVGNPKLAGWDTNKAVKLTVGEADYSAGSIAIQTGIDGAVASNTDYVYTDVFLATSATAADLTKLPYGTAGSEVKFIYKLNADGSLGTKYTQAAAASSALLFSVSSKAVTFNAGSGLVANDQLVAFYNVTTAASTVTIKNQADVFSKTVKAVCSSLVRDLSTQSDYAAEIIIWKAKFDNSFNLSVSAGGDPAVHNLSAEALVSKSGGYSRLWDLLITDESLITT